MKRFLIFAGVTALIYVGLGILSYFLAPLLGRTYDQELNHMALAIACAALVMASRR